MHVKFPVEARQHLGHLRQRQLQLARAEVRRRGDRQRGRLAVRLHEQSHGQSRGQMLCAEAMRSHSAPQVPRQVLEAHSAQERTEAKATNSKWQRLK